MDESTRQDNDELGSPGILAARTDGEQITSESVKLFRPLPLGRPQEVNHAFSFTYRDAGHLLGAASADVTVREEGRETRVLFSGDVGRFDAVLTRDPVPAPDADYLVVESPYGNRTHPDLSILDQLEGVLKKTFARGGVLLIPAFAVGRAQQMIWRMDQLVTEGRMRAFPIHVDIPMAIDATRIYASYPWAHRVSLSAIGGRSALAGKDGCRMQSNLISKIEWGSLYRAERLPTRGGRFRISSD